MKNYRLHFFVCIQVRASEDEPSCGAKGSPALITRMLEELEKHGLGEEVAVTGCHCPGPGVGTCERGPMVIVYPDGVWYANVRADDVAEIVESHVAHGKPVERLMYKE